MSDLSMRVTFNPNLLGGKPTIRGLRISVEQILKALANEVPVAELLADYPDLEREDILACLDYGARLVAEEPAEQKTSPASQKTFGDLYGVFAGEGSISEADLEAAKYRFEWAGHLEG
jgi:uncharacterized protein (DUF433 family)